jgi:cell division protein FtsL
MTRFLILGVLGVATFLSALQVVNTRYETRLLVIQLQEMKSQRDELEREWTRLLLEQGTWNTHGRVEEIAGSRLDMMVPEASRTRNMRS